MKRVFLILLLVLLSVFCLPAMAQEPPQVLDEAELNAIVASCLEGCGANESNFGLAFYYTGTDESFFYQADNHFYSASLYKLPLCMRYAERVAQGELSWDTSYNTQSIDYLVYRTLVYSDNNTASSLVYRDTDFLYGTNPYSLYSGFSEEELAQMRNANDFSPRFMLNTLKTLYDEPERFPRILDYMKDACPEDYFRGILGDRYVIAQKYGQADGVLHTAGILYTPTPIILVVMCDHMYGQRDAIERLAEAMADYSLELDARLAEQKQQAAEQLEALATPVPTEKPQSVSTAQATEAVIAEAPAEQKSMLPFSLCCGAAVFVSCCVVLFRKKH